MKRLCVLSAATLALAACQTPEPKVDFPEEEKSRWTGGPSEAARLAPLPPRPAEPTLAGEVVAPNELLLGTTSEVPGSGLTYRAIALPRRFGRLSGSIHPAVTKGMAAARSRGPALTKCADDRGLIAGGAEGVSATGEFPNVVLVSPALGISALAAGSDAAEEGARKLGAGHAVRRSAHLAWWRSVQLDGDPGLEAIVGLSTAASIPDCGIGVAVETAFLDDDGRELVAEPAVSCLDAAREHFCAETDDARHCDPNALDAGGFAEVAPVPLGAATLQGGGVLLVSEQRGDESRTLWVRLVRGAEILALGSVGFPASDAETGACR